MSRHGAEPVSITNAPIAHSQDIRGREVRYLLSMLVRTGCFVAAVVTSGPLRWVFIAGALLLPYVAVVLANAGSRRSPQNATFTPEPFGVLAPGATLPPRDGPPGATRPSTTETG